MNFVPLAGKALGAEVVGLDAALDHLSDEQFSQIQDALCKHSLLIFRNQGNLSPHGAASFLHRFDPNASTVWRDQATNPWELYKAKYLGTAGTFQLPDCPACLCLGNGEVRNHFGLNATLGGKRLAYGKAEGSQVIGGGKLQWHIDGAFWKSRAASGLPCLITGMRCFEAPSDGSSHEIDLGDGSNLKVARGATAFVSAREAFNRLTPAEQTSALQMTARYAIHPFKRFSKLGMTADGLKCTGGLADETPINEEDRQEGSFPMRLPLVWTHPVTGQQALMPHTRCIEALETSKTTADGNGRRRVEISVDATREYLHTLMRRAVDVDSVYAHAWRSDDFVIWDNRSIWHSATGGMRPDDRRIMHLIAYDGSCPPVCTAHRGVPINEASAASKTELSILALIIGQTPRPDLVRPIEELLASRLKHCTTPSITCCGALDGADQETLRLAMTRDASCPLVTRLADGQGIVVSEGVIAQLLEQKLQAANGNRMAKGQSPFSAAILLCAGEFAGFLSQTALPLVKPSLVAQGAVHSVLLSVHPACRKLTLFVPNEDQGTFAVERWSRWASPQAQDFIRDVSYRLLPEDAGPSEISSVITAACKAADSHQVPQQVHVCVLDFFGHADATVEVARQAAIACNAILLDVGSLAADMLCSSLLEQARE